MNCLTKSKCVTTQMKALDEYFLMVVFTLLLNEVHVFAIFMFNLDRETHGSERVKPGTYTYRKYNMNGLKANNV